MKGLSSICRAYTPKMWVALELIALVTSIALVALALQGKVPPKVPLKFAIVTLSLIAFNQCNLIALQILHQCTKTNRFGFNDIMIKMGFDSFRNFPHSSTETNNS